MRDGLRPVPQMQAIVEALKDSEISGLAEHFSKLPTKSMEARADPKLMKQGMERAKALRCGVCHLANFHRQN